MSVLVFTHPACLLHNAGPGHPESPKRLEEVLQALRAPEFSGKVELREAPTATREQVLRAHTEEYLQRVEAFIPKEGIGQLDVDTRACPDTWEASWRAAGAAVAAVDAVVAGPNRAAFCATRPPGHHALRGSSMGFCIFGNAAIAALHGLSAHGLQRVAIVDWDVHHGNGTQDIVEGNEAVFLASLQQQPLWPGTGKREDSKTRNVLNIPFPPHAPASAWREAFEKEVLPALEKHRPELVVISAGFDAHRDDPPQDVLFNDPPGYQNLLDEDYVWMTERLKEVAQKHAQGRIVSILEGGYNTAVLAKACAAHVSALSS